MTLLKTTFESWQQLYYNNIYNIILLYHGRRNGFESGTAEGVEHEPPEAANRDAEGVDGFSPSPTRGSGGNFLEIYERIGAFWSTNHR